LQGEQGSTALPASGLLQRARVIGNAITTPATITGESVVLNVSFWPELGQSAPMVIVLGEPGQLRSQYWPVALAKAAGAWRFCGMHRGQCSDEPTGQPIIARRAQLGRNALAFACNNMNLRLPCL
jgi:hypothetical protein